MNFSKFLTKSVLFIALGISSSFAEENTEKVLVLGANQFVEPSWTGSHDANGTVCAESLGESGIELTTICDIPLDPEIQYPNSLGTHITLDWNNDVQLQTNLVDDYEGHFDLITNDYCVSYFIHDKTLPSFLKTLKVDGKFVYGPMGMHVFTPVSISHPLTQSDVDDVKRDGDISFYRYGIGTFNVGEMYSFDITMAKNDQQHREHHLQHIAEWPGEELWDFNGVAESKSLMTDFINYSYDTMTLENFIAFINENCDFQVSVEIVDENNELVQDVFNRILPPNHPGSNWGAGDWVVMTRITE